MSRGEDNQPDDKHWGPGVKCEIVLWEQDKHRDISKGNGAGFTGGRAGPDWQSHHIVCISSMGDRHAKDDPTQDKMEKSLYITKWNINEAPNMIGLPQRCWYRQEYGDAEWQPTAATKAAAWAKVKPTNLPAHNNDHNTTGGYTDEVTIYLDDTIWSKFEADKGDHKADAEWLKKKLEAASKHFQTELTNRGGRPPGTVTGWQQRFTLTTTWYHPFSMAKKPEKRSAGLNVKALTNIFSRL